MRYQEWLDSLSIDGFFLSFVLVTVAVAECGYRIGRWWQFRTPGDKEGPTNMIVGSLLGLLAFLLAVTMGMASDRFDTRRGMVLTEANVIGTTYLRAGFLPETEASETRELLHQYVWLRIVVNDPQDVPERIEQSLELHNELWAIAERLANSMPDSEILALYIESLNELIDIHQSRLTAGVYARLPGTIVLLLLATSVLSLAMVGYSAGLTGRRSPLTAIGMIIVLGAVITLLLDLERPRSGLVTINQQPLIDLRQSITAEPETDDET